MACRSGCVTQDHASYGECARVSGARVVYGAQARSHTDRELANYRAARKAGVQPAGTTQAAIDAANAMSDKYNAPFDAGTGLVGGKVPMRGEAV